MLVRLCHDLFHALSSPSVLHHLFITERPTFTAKVDADKYMKYGTILDTSGSGWQLGQGAYMAGGTHDWIMGGKYVCFVYVDPGKWAQTPKVWIPEYDETRPGARVELWKKEPVSGTGPCENAWVRKDTRRREDEKTMHLVIPPALQGKTPLGLVVNCVQESQVQKGVFPTLNYVSPTKEWNILGISPTSEHKMYLPGIRPEYSKRPSPARSVKSQRRRK
ncbi:unnamed protein product [Cyclocybe aegerita]|uniref:Uncharacterized protein n=1 Tax=Cyclocybe aegerita TaxID=1973307 RepID=A0A8S0W9I7_CYCAE|nr:unnamed protein product [Cyclocybe aegerita]